MKSTYLMIKDSTGRDAGGRVEVVEYTAEELEEVFTPEQRDLLGRGEKLVVKGPRGDLAFVDLTVLGARALET